MGSYKGESNGKKIGRLEFWLQVREAIGSERMRHGRHLVLASRSCGDVSVLVGMGIPQENIIAVDIDPEAIAVCRSRFPGVVTHVGDVGDISAQYRQCITTACLDWCGNLSDALIDATLSVVVGSMEHDGVLGIAYMRGREHRVMTDALVEGNTGEMELYKAVRRFGYLTSRKMSGVARISESGSPPPSPRDFCISTHPMAGYGARVTDRTRSDDRVYHLVQTLQRRAIGRQCAPLLRCVINYHSRTPVAQGVPMAMVLTSIFRTRSLLGPHVVEKRCANYSMTLPDPFVVNVRYPIRHPEMVGFVESFHGVVAHRALNVPSGTLAAWRAHRTMGTYDKVRSSVPGARQSGTP